MKSFIESLDEAMSKTEDTIQTVLRMWKQSADGAEIVKVTGKTIPQIKNILKKAGKKGWEEL